MVQFLQPADQVCKAHITDSQHLQQLQQRRVNCTLGCCQKGHLLPDTSCHLLQHLSIIRGECEVALLSSLSICLMLLLLLLLLPRLLYSLLLALALLPACLLLCGCWRSSGCSCS